MKQFGVIGLGSFGWETAMRLAANGCDVLALDNDRELVEELKDKITKAVIGDASDKRTLERLGLEDFDGVVVSLGEALESSVLCVLHLKDIGVKHVTAKAINEDHAKILRKVGADKIVNPERDRARQLADVMSWTGVISSLVQGDGYVIVEVAPPSFARGKSIIECGFREKFGVMILMVKDVLTGKVFLPPNPTAVIKDSDMLVVMGAKEKIDKLYK